MFEFQNLKVYQKSKKFYLDTRELISSVKPDTYMRDQLSRAAFSIPLNLAEGSGKFSKADRRNFFTTARASVFECAAIIDILKDEGYIAEPIYFIHLEKADELSRILYSMIQNLNK